MELYLSPVYVCQVLLVSYVCPLLSVKVPNFVEYFSVFSVNSIQLFVHMHLAQLTVAVNESG